VALTRSELCGAIPAIVTPFSKDGATVDHQSLERLALAQLQGGCAGIVVCGSTGEAVTLDDHEYRAVIATVSGAVRSFGKGFCVAGIGSSSTARAAAIAESLGDSVDALLLVTPPYNKPTQEGILAHFEAVRAKAKAPIIAYNVPGRTASNMLPATVATLAERGVIIGIKESSGSIDQVTEIAAAVGNSISVLSGEDSLVLPTLVLGGRGVVTVTGNVVPEKVSAMVASGLAGEWERCRALQFETLPLTKSMFMETNPIPVKAALALKGMIAHPTVRLPLTPATRATIDRLKHILAL
jgi:4-hydroxy-tetrahydrodipicolinate synthase